MGYPIAGVQEESSGGAAAEKPIEAYLATADAAKGGDTFKKCMACHNADKGGANQMGPNLWGVIGEPIGQGKGFAFSDALAKKGGNWNWDNLSQWLTSPKAFAPGTKMTFAGLSNPQDRANVIAFLNQHSDAPLPLPAAPAAGASDTAQKDAGTKPGTGPNNGPVKADKEPVLKTGAATGKTSEELGGTGEPRRGQIAFSCRRCRSCRRRRRAPRRSCGHSPTPRRRPPPNGGARGPCGQ